MIPFHIVLRPHDPHRPIIDHIAQGRNIDSDHFRQSRSLRKTGGDPLLFNDMTKAVDRIITAYKTNEHMTIFADYDVDGVSSATLLSFLFRDIIPYQHITVMFPDRLEDGYGLKTKHLDLIKQSGSTLVITVDNGITSLHEAEYARGLGIDLILLPTIMNHYLAFLTHTLSSIQNIPLPILIMIFVAVPSPTNLPVFGLIVSFQNTIVRIEKHIYSLSSP